MNNKPAPYLARYIPPPPTFHRPRPRPRPVAMTAILCFASGAAMGILILADAPLVVVTIVAAMLGYVAGRLPQEIGGAA